MAGCTDSGWMKEDDPRYQDGWVIDIRPEFGRHSKPLSEHTPQKPSNNTGTAPPKAEQAAEE